MKHALFFLTILFALHTHAAQALHHGEGYGGVLDIPPGMEPQLVFETPRVAGPPASARQTPLYLHVPQEQARRWANHCARYEACGRPVWFVSDEWYFGIFRAHGLPPSADPEEHLVP